MTHTLPVSPDRYGQPGHFNSPVRLLVAGSRNRAGFGVGGWTAEGTGRLVFQGPLVSGPHAYAYGLASVIDNAGGTGAEIAAESAAGTVIRAEVGDSLSIAGTLYRLDWYRGMGREDRHNIVFVPVV